MKIKINNPLAKMTFGVFAFILTVSFLSCEKDQGNYPSEPTLAMEGDSDLLLKPNTPIVIQLKFDAPGPDTRLLINKNDGPYRSIRLQPDDVSYTFNEDQIDADAFEGETVSYEFFLTNGANEKKSAGVGVQIGVEIYDKMQIGSTEVYEVPIPAEGIWADGELVLAAGRKYYLASGLQFAEGTKFSAAAGAEIYLSSDEGDDLELVFDAGSEVDIRGTASAPVIITSEKVLLGEEPGDSQWGMFNIKGSGSGSNSGTVQYLRLEYGGERAFRLQNVGNGTTIDHVQVYKSNEEAIMVTDGDVNMSHLLVTDCKGASYRLGDAYAGQIQFAIALTPEYEDELEDFAVREMASPVIANLSVIGPGESVDNTHGIRLRAASSARIYNAIVAFYPRRGIRLNDDVVTDDIHGPTTFAYSYIFNVPRDPFRDDRSGATNPFAGSFSGGTAHNPYFNNVIFDEDGSRSYVPIAGIGVGNYVPAEQVASEFNPSTLGSFFQDAPFVGAVENAENDWTIGWTKDIDGQIKTNGK